MTSPHFRIVDERGERIDPVVPESMRPFLLERADGSSGSVELTAVDVVTADGRLVGHATASPEGAGGWAVHVQDADHDVTGRAPNTDAVFDLLRSWAAGDGWWREAFSWRAVAAAD